MHFDQFGPLFGKFFEPRLNSLCLVICDLGPSAGPEKCSDAAGVLGPASLDQADLFQSTSPGKLDVLKLA